MYHPAAKNIDQSNLRVNAFYPVWIKVSSMKLSLFLQTRDDFRKWSECECELLSLQ